MTIWINSLIVRLTSLVGKSKTRVIQKRQTIYYGILSLLAGFSLHIPNRSFFCSLLFSIHVFCWFEKKFLKHLKRFSCFSSQFFFLSSSIPDPMFSFPPAVVICRPIFGLLHTSYSWWIAIRECGKMLTYQQNNCQA